MMDDKSIKKDWDELFKEAEERLKIYQKLHDLVEVIKFSQPKKLKYDAGTTIISKLKIEPSLQLSITRQK